MSNVRGDLYVPRAQTDIFNNSIAVNGAHMWNGLPGRSTSKKLVLFKRAYNALKHATDMHNAMKYLHRLGCILQDLYASF